MRWISTSVVAGLALSACDGEGTDCTLIAVSFPVVVLDANGVRMADVAVSATNLETGKVINARTDDNGETFAIGEGIGGGAVRILATHDGMSAGVDTLWTCDECHCTPSQPGATFTLRRVVACTTDWVTVDIAVVDSAARPVDGVVVTATNIDNGRTQTSPGSYEGWAYIGEDIGAGTVRLVAELEGRASEPVEVEWTCDECHCYPERDQLTLTLPD